MKRKGLDNCLPLELLKKINDQIPWIWEEAEEFRKYNERKNYSLWPRWCYVPVSVFLNIIGNGNDRVYYSPEGMKYARLAQISAALAPWRISKEIYVMDSEVEKILLDQDDTKVEADILLNLPYYCFYIKTNLIDNMDGFFVSLEYDDMDKSKEIRFVYIRPNMEWFEVPVFLKYQTIQESLEFLFKDGGLELDDESSKRTCDLINKSLQLVLYILAANSDIEENVEQKKIYKPSSKNQSTVKDKYSEVRKWDVGYRVGKSIRVNTERTKSETEYSHNTGSHSPKRPHMRRGHWHNFWTGPRDGDRKLVLRWVPPTFIGLKENTPIVYHDVK